MKKLVPITLLAIACLTGFLVSSCWVDIEQYEDQTCDRFGGDFDNDGVCSSLDCDDFNPNIYAGAPCDDRDSTTVNDVYTVDCICKGTE